jgi:hypothetical protein
MNEKLPRLILLLRGGLSGWYSPSSASSRDSCLYDVIATASDHVRVKHSAMFVTPEGLHTNHVECFFNEMRRGQAGRYHRFGFGHLKYYAAEMGLRIEMRDKANDARLFDLAERVFRSGPSTQLADMWNKRPKAGKPKVEKPSLMGLAFAVPRGSLTIPAEPLAQHRRKRTSRDTPRSVSPEAAS